MSCLVEPVAVLGAESRFLDTVKLVEARVALLRWPGRDRGMPLAGFKDSIEPLTVLL